MSQPAIKPLIVLIRNIDLVKPPQGFDPKQIEIAARAILNGGALITPLILERNGHERYWLIAGKFQYCAAMRALEIDPIRGESIDAYVIDSSNREQMREQLQIFMGISLEEETQPTKVKGSKASKVLKAMNTLPADVRARWEGTV